MFKKIRGLHQYLCDFKQTRIDKVISVQLLREFFLPGLGIFGFFYSFFLFFAIPGTTKIR